MELASRTVAAAVSAEAGPDAAQNPDRARHKTSAQARAVAKEFRKDMRSRYRLLLRLVPSIRMWRYQWSAPREVRHSGPVALLAGRSDPIVCASLASRDGRIAREAARAGGKGCDERPRGRPDHRRRRFGRRGGVVAGRDQDAHSLPGAGGLDEPGGISQHGPGLGSQVLRGVVVEPEYPRPARGLSDQRRQFADQGREL